MNLLRGEHGHGNHWFYGMARHPNHADYGQCQAIGAAEQPAILAFVGSLPLALERADLRVMHAAWVDMAIDACRGLDLPAYEAYRTSSGAAGDPANTPRCARGTRRRWLHSARPCTTASGCRTTQDIGPYDAFIQNMNPVRVITSGLERATPTPRFVAERWRFVQRVAWWRDYAGYVPVLFGHYWRWWDPAAQAQLSMGIAPLFTDDPVGPFMAAGHTGRSASTSAPVHASSSVTWGTRSPITHASARCAGRSGNWCSMPTNPARCRR